MNMCLVPFQTKINLVNCWWTFTNNIVAPRSAIDPLKSFMSLAGIIRSGWLPNAKLKYQSPHCYRLHVPLMHPVPWEVGGGERRVNLSTSKGLWRYSGSHHSTSFFFPVLHSQPEPFPAYQHFSAQSDQRRRQREIQAQTVSAGELKQLKAHWGPPGSIQRVTSMVWWWISH